MYVVVEDAGMRHDDCGCGYVRMRMSVCKRDWRVVSC